MTETGPFGILLVIYLFLCENLILAIHIKWLFMEKPTYSSVFVFHLK